MSSQLPGSHGLLGDLFVEHRDLEAISISPELWLLLTSLESERQGCHPVKAHQTGMAISIVRLPGACDDLVVIPHLHSLQRLEVAKGTDSEVTVPRF